MITRVLLITFLSFPILLQAQTAPQMSASEIKLGLEKLGVTGSVLYIAAHPDDENTRLLTWLSKSRKVRTGYLSLTRGDGGQNLIGTEQAEELGLIRTQELLAARKIDGAEQFFARAIDFGFSKNADETFRIWNKELILSDVVRTIRSFKPDIIITRFPPDARAGHGNHTASAMLAVEAFAAAADPQKFRDLGKPWQVKRVLWNTFNFGGNNTTSPDQLKVDVGGYNALLGKSYGELAAESRSQHKTQGFGSSRQRGQEFEFFSLLAGEAAKNDLLDGIDISWGRVRNGKSISDLIHSINAEFNMVNPAKSVPDLLRLRSLIGKIDDTVLRTKKLKELDELILSCGGIWFEINSLQPEVSAGDSIRVRIQAISLVQDSLQMPVLISEAASGMPYKPLSGKVFSLESRIAPAGLTQPYWLTYDRTLGSYSDSPGAMDRPENVPPSGRFSIKLGNDILEAERGIFYKYTDPVKGEVYQPLVVTPPVTVSAGQKLIFSGDNASSPSVKVKVTAKRDHVRGNVSLKSTDPQFVAGSSKPFELEKKEDIVYIDFPLVSAQNKQSAAPVLVRVSAEMQGKSFSYDEKTISYNHLPAITYFPHAEFKYLAADIKTSGKRLAYIPGAGDRIPEALERIGYAVDILTADQAVNADLHVYDAIIAGVRLYNVSTAVNTLTPKLMEYVKNGGTYVVQYNVSNGLKTNLIGPYPFRITNSRVTDETAQVTILNQEHAILNYPNKITTADFNNWVQERGLYFVSEYGTNYTPVLAMNDPGEAENKGSLIVTDHGKGRFVYTSLSFFRQLPAGVPGAYRLFVNLIAKRKQ